MTTKERRQDVRAFVNIPVDITVQDRFYPGWVKNMATGGVFVKVKGSFSVGQDISFYFLGENQFATVIRVEPQGIGVKFGKL
jgi:Tfp pilus assembly protein PilZ